MVKFPFELIQNQKDVVEKTYTILTIDDAKFATINAATGTGKSAMMAALIDKLQIPTIILSHNKILAKQLYDEFCGFYDPKHVNYFISHFEYYQAEAYVPSIDKYFEKETIVDKEIDRMRVRATRNIIKNPFSITVASVSAIFGAGFPLDYERNKVTIYKGMKISIYDFCSIIVKDMFYERVPQDMLDYFNQFSVIGDTIIMKGFDNEDIRIINAFDEIEKITINNIEYTDFDLYPAYHFFSQKDMMDKGLEQIEIDLENQVKFFTEQGKLLEARRIEDRVQYDISMIRELGYVRGMENYVSYFNPGDIIKERPYCLLDYYTIFHPANFLIILDESHVMIPQITGMIKAHMKLKDTLIDYGFRLPSCKYNRPLSYSEFLQVGEKYLFVSATPSDRELLLSGDNVVESFVRPTGIIEPEIFIKPLHNQIDTILQLLKEQKQTNSQTIILTLTIVSAEHLYEYLNRLGHNVVYIHGGIKPKERLIIFQQIRERKFDIIIGCNILREGIDLPAVSCVCVLDADKEGFLRNVRGLQQMCGRAARNVNGKIYLFADKITKSMQTFIDISDERRQQQIDYNELHNIVPKQIYKTSHNSEHKKEQQIPKRSFTFFEREINKSIKKKDFEYAAKLRNAYKEYYPLKFSLFKPKIEVDFSEFYNN